MRLLCLLPFLVAACSTPATPPYADLASYDCADGTTLRVRFGREGAHVTLADDSVLILPQQVSGSGFWYATPQHELRGKGAEATWTAAAQAPLQCSARR